MDKKVTVLAAGNTLYVFDVGDERIYAQYVVCVGANLAVAQADYPADRLESLIEAIREESDEPIELEDCRIK